MTPEKLLKSKTFDRRLTSVDARNLKSEIEYLNEKISDLQSIPSSSKGANNDIFVFSKGPSLKSSFALDEAPHFYSAATSG